MGERGPRPTPTAVKQLFGNPGRRPLNEREPKPAPGLPPCPEHLQGIAHDKWEEIGRKLVRYKVMTEADAMALEILCETYANYRSATERVKQTGHAIVQKDDKGEVKLMRNPFTVEAHKYKAELMTMLREFGLTPTSRVDIQVADDADAVLAEFGIVG